MANDEPCRAEVQHARVRVGPQRLAADRGPGRPVLAVEGLHRQREPAALVPELLDVLRARR